MEEYKVAINGIDGFFRDHLIGSPAKMYTQNSSSFMAMQLESRWKALERGSLISSLQAKRVQWDRTKPLSACFVGTGLL